MSIEIESASLLGSGEEFVGEIISLRVRAARVKRSSSFRGAMLRIGPHRQTKLDHLRPELDRGKSSPTFFTARGARSCE